MGRRHSLARWHVLLMAMEENECNHKNDLSVLTAHICIPSASYIKWLFVQVEVPMRITEGFP